MISVKDAAAAAAKALVDSFGASSPRLEEVEFSDDQNAWLITLSFLREIEPDELVTSVFDIPNAAKLAKRMRREYKTVRVDAIHGEVKSIRIRELQSHGSAVE